MLRKRIIPVLLLKGSGLVKTVKFAEPKYIGDPINVVKIFNEKEADELLLLDITASRERRPPHFELIQEIVSEAFMPVCYGGGVRSVDDAKRLLKLGLEKIAVNYAALESLGLVRELSARFGAQCVVGAIDVKKTLFGRDEVWAHAKAKPPETDPLRWARRLIESGAGEILLTSVDRDGTMRGYDLKLLESFNRKLSVPLVACGGAGSFEHMREAFAACDLSGLGVGSRFVYQGPHKAVLVSYLSTEEINSLP